MKFRSVTSGLAVAALLALPAISQAAVSKQEAAKLGKQLTCVGAIRAGNKAGTIPAFSGQYVDRVPGWTGKPHSGEQPIDPYANEKPKFTITAQNVSTYKDHLSKGQIAMFKHYPKTFKIHVYPTHRDFGYSKKVCADAKWNAKHAHLVHGGMGVYAIGHFPFPIPKTGLQLFWDQLLPYRAHTYDKTIDIASVQADGTIGYGRSRGRCLAASNSLNTKEAMSTTGVSARCMNNTLLPTRERGHISLNYEPYDYTDKRQAWTYNPGTRRVRLSPGYGFDQALAGSNGNMTIDDARLFNGSPERYNWKIIGKKEMYVPANAYKPNLPSVSYKELLTPHHENPKYMRYELHRVWILQAALKKDSRHIYGKRRLFIDEDLLVAVMADNYDTRGQLWKHDIVDYYYHPDTGGWYAGVSFYHNLNNGEYVAYNLTNEQRKGPILNKNNMKASDYTPNRLRAMGH